LPLRIYVAIDKVVEREKSDPPPGCGQTVHIASRTWGQQKAVDPTYTPFAHTPTESETLSINHCALRLPYQF